MNLNRRQLLQLPALAFPVKAFSASGEPAPWRFHHDHIMGTSLDLEVFANTARDADAAEAAALREIARLSRILSTYDPSSEASRLTPATTSHSPELTAVLAAYRQWSAGTGGAISSRIGDKLNLDALGKPFIAAKAVEAARATGIAGIMLDAGGDVIVSGRAGANTQWPIGVSDPGSPYHNAPPLSILKISEGAIATSGTTARGAHVVDPRTGNAASGVLSATVVAPDAITANALSTALCVLGPDEGVKLVERTPGAECLVVSAAGRQYRSAGFSRFERPVILPAMAEASDWPEGYEVLIDLNLKNAGGRRPYVAVWVEDTSKKLVRNVILFAGKPRYLNELHSWWNINSNNPLWYTSSRPTPSPGRYLLRWDGLNEKRQAVPQGTYKITVETAREHSYYEKESALLPCLAGPSTATIKKTPEFEPVTITYGPKKQLA